MPRPPSRRLAPWATLAVLVLLAGGAATASALTAPAISPALGALGPEQIAKPPGAPCQAPPGSPTLPLTDQLPRPSITVEPGAAFTVMVPPWHWGRATDLTIVRPDVLSERCSVGLADGGRRAVVVGKASGRSYVGATVTPASDAMMPAWGGGVTVVSPASTSTTASTVVLQPPSSTSTTTSVVPAPPGTLVLTQSSAGRSFSITGQLVQVVLPGPQAYYQGFTTPESSDTAVVAPDGVACPAPSGDSCTEFIGSDAGSARLTSGNNPACLDYSPPCELPSEAWSVTLTVR